MFSLKNLSSKKYFLLDLDGTLYRGTHLFPFTQKFIQTLRETGRKPIFFSNNSSKSTEEYMEKLSKLGLNPRRDEIYNSATATINYLNNKNLKKIFLLAVPSVEEEFTQAGFQLAHELVPALAHPAAPALTRVTPSLTLDRSRASASTSTKKSLPQAVVLAFDQTFTYQKFCQAYDFIMAGVPFYATHPDLLLPLTEGFHPDIGTLISAFVTATGKKPTIIGKPYKPIFQQLQKRFHCKKSEMIMIGDRLTTDIKGANDFSITSVLVLSGETTLAMLKKSKIKPKMVLKNVGDLTLQL